MYDYRKIDAEAEELRKRGLELSQKRDLDALERDEALKIVGRLEVLDKMAVELRDAEIAEAREIAARGQVPGGTTPEDEAAADFRAWIKTGEVRAALVAGTDANGGYIVPEPEHAPLIEKVRKINPIMDNSTIIPMAGDTTMYLPYKDAHGVGAIAAETGARAEQTEPTVANYSLVAYDHFTNQYASQTFLDASGAEDLLMGWIYEDIFDKFRNATVVGTGSSQPLGVFAATSVYTTTLSGSAGALSNTGILTQFFTLNAKYRRSAKWYMAPASLSTLLGLAMPNLNNTPLVNTLPDGTFTILGKPVVEVDDAPAIGAANFPVAFGDLAAGYVCGVHKSVQILRDPYTQTPYVRFYGLARLGGRPWDPQGVILQKSNNA